MTLPQIAKIKRLMEKATQDKCIEWNGAKARGNYGAIRFLGKTEKLHRAVMMMYGHEIAGKVVLHTCDNPKCFNILHLRIGTQRDNMEDMKRKGRARNYAMNHPSDTCKRGHPRSLFGVIRCGTMHCRECQRLRYHARKNNEVLP